jgi:hypothetical protein
MANQTGDFTVLELYLHLSPGHNITGPDEARATFRNIDHVPAFSGSRPRAHNAKANREVGGVADVPPLFDAHFLDSAV